MATFTKFVFTLAVAVPLALSSVAVQAGGHAAKQKDIGDTAVSAGSFKTLVAAVKAAGLVATLKGKGPLPSSRQTMLLSQNYRRELWKHC